MPKYARKNRLGFGSRIPRQLFNKSGTIIAFFACTFFLCTFLISVLFNTGNGDIYGQFSKDAVYAVIEQDETKENALSYSDIAAKLSEFPNARGAVFLELFDISGYLLFDNDPKGGFSGVFRSVNTNTDEPQLILAPAYEPLCMSINGASYLNLNGKKYRVVGNNIYKGMSGAAFYGNFAGIKDSNTKFQGLSIIIDAGKETPRLLNALNSKMSDANISSKSLSYLKKDTEGIGMDKIFVSFAVFMIGAMLITSAKASTENWAETKMSEIKARRICGANDDNIRNFIFVRYFAVCITGIMLGAAMTALSVGFTPAVYYLGSINIFAGAASAAFLALFGGISAYRFAIKISRRQIVMLRRE